MEYIALIRSNSMLRLVKAKSQFKGTSEMKSKQKDAFCREPPINKLRLCQCVVREQGLLKAKNTFL